MEISTQQETNKGDAAQMYSVHHIDALKVERIDEENHQ
jgi:hypothetical protein